MSSSESLTEGEDEVSSLSDAVASKKSESLIDSSDQDRTEVSIL